MSVEKFVPDIQEKLRHNGFPKFVRGKIPEITFVLGDAAPKISITDKFEFQNKESDLGIVLTSTTLAIHTNNYESFEEFEKTIITAINAVHGSLQLSIAERVGLRYVDLIRLEQDENWKDYVQTGLLGFDSKKLGADPLMSKFEFLGTTDFGKILLRFSQSDQVVPPELQPQTLKQPIKLKEKEVVMHLDCDHFSEDQCDFDPELMVSKIGDLHDHIDRAFRSAVTAQALKKWGA
jgi:uncharacterized protein (TIGR04255 family)